MKTLPRLLTLLASLLVGAPAAHSQIAPGELVAPKIEICGGNVNFMVQPSVAGRNYQLQYSDSMALGTWQNLGVVRSGDGTNLLMSTPYVTGVRKRFYRLLLTTGSSTPEGFSLIPAGSFQMGDQSSPLVANDDEPPVHSVSVSAFYMAKYEVSKALWNEVATWAAANGYDINAAGASGKGTNHPAYYVTWHECVKWCNARAEGRADPVLLPGCRADGSKGCHPRFELVPGDPGRQLERRRAPLPCRGPLLQQPGQQLQQLGLPRSPQFSPMKQQAASSPPLRSGPCNGLHLKRAIS